MTELSPAAQAVLDAVKEICPAPAGEIAAAALRAAAYQFNCVEAMPGAPFCQNKLLAIANELEVQ